MTAKINVFSVFVETTVSDEADVMSSGRLFQSFAPAEANDRLPAVTRPDGRTERWLEVDDQSQLGSLLTPVQWLNDDEIDSNLKTV